MEENTNTFEAPEALSEDTIDALNAAEIVPSKTDKNIRNSGRPFLMINIIERPAVTHERVEVLIDSTGKVFRKEDLIRDEEGKLISGPVGAVRTKTIKKWSPNVTPTHRKGWRDNPKNLTAFEQPYIVDRVKARHLRETNVIIDILRGELIKSNLHGHQFTADENVVEHYLSKYMDICKRGIDAYLTKMADSFVASGKAEEIKKQFGITEDDAEGTGIAG